MNPIRVILAALGGFVAYFAVGAALFALVPSLINESRKYPSIFRDKDGQMSHMPVGMAWMFVSMLAMATIYATLCRGGSGLVEGLRFGALIGVFAVGAFVVHNYVNLNIELKLTVQSAIAHCLEWTVTGLRRRINA